MNHGTRGPIQVDPMLFSYYSNDVGGGTIFLEPGNYTLSVMVGPQWDLTTTLAEIPIEITESNSCDTVLFGLFPNQEESLILTSIQSPPTRCNEFITFEVYAKNVGTTIESVTRWLEADSNILAIDLLESPDTIIEPYTFGWHFNNLSPSQSINRTISVPVVRVPNSSYVLPSLTSIICIRGNIFHFIKRKD